MGRKRFSPEQIIVKLREAEIFESKSLTQVEAAKKPGLTSIPHIPYASESRFVLLSWIVCLRVRGPQF